MTLLERLIPKKFGEKERFRPDEVMEILGFRDLRTLRAKDHLLHPIQTSARVLVYTRESLETYLKAQNHIALERIK